MKRIYSILCSVFVLGIAFGKVEAGFEGPKVALHVSAMTSTSSFCSTWDPNARNSLFGLRV